MNPEPGPGQGAAGAGRGGAGDGVTYIFCPLNLLLPSVATAELRLRQLATGADGPPSPAQLGRGCWRLVRVAGIVMETSVLSPGNSDALPAQPQRLACSPLATRPQVTAAGKLA